MSKDDKPTFTMCRCAAASCKKTQLLAETVLSYEFTAEQIGPYFTTLARHINRAIFDCGEAFYLLGSRQTHKNPGPVDC